MKKEEMIWIASVAIGKNLDYETLGYSHYMDEVWAYVEEAKTIKN